MYFRRRKWYTEQEMSDSASGGPGWRAGARTGGALRGRWSAAAAWKEKISMSIQLLKRSPESDRELKEYERNLRIHRLKNRMAGLGILAALLVCIAAVRLSMRNRIYTDYEVTASYERTDTVTTQYIEFLDDVLKYSQDGISCVNSQNQAVWSQSYSIQNPMVEVCGKSAAVAEENGTTAMIFDENGLAGTVTTNYPIRRICVSSQGVLAALLEDGAVSRLYLYDKSGEELVEAKFELPDTGYPLAMSLSADATKLAVSFLQIQDGSVNSCIAFYNFDSVGENVSDHLVASRVLKGELIPSLHYLDSAHCYAVGTEQILLYEGTQIPEEAAQISLDRKLLSVFSSDEYLGVVLEGVEKNYALQVYTIRGNLQFETEFDQDYTTLKFSGDNILIYNDFDCMMLNHSGRVFFEGTFEESISDLYTMSGTARYVVMHASRTDQIRLR